MKSQSHKDLEIWRIGMDVAQIVYRMTASFPSEERYGFTSQIRRSAVSIPANIAEGWGRGTKANLANFVGIARGSACELECLCQLANSLGFLALEDTESILERLNAFGRKSYLFLSSLKSDVVREDIASYGLDDH